jgi:hypothetical protein
MGLLGGVAKFFAGGGAKQAVELADDFHYSSEERHGDDSDYTSESQSQQMISYDGDRTGFDVFVDCISRLIRPGITIWLVGGMATWWALPKPETIDPFWQKIFIIVITFWFGGRAIMKEIPALLTVINKLRRK